MSMRKKKESVCLKSERHTLYVYRKCHNCTINIWQRSGLSKPDSQKKKKKKTHTKQLTVKFLRRPLDVKFQPFPFGRLDRLFPRRLPPNRLNSNSHKGIFSLRFQPNCHSASPFSLLGTPVGRLAARAATTNSGARG